MKKKTILNSKVAAEFIAGGLLADVFHDIEPLVEKNNTKTPDFKLSDSVFLEVYCPQTSRQNIESVEEQRKAQEGRSVSIAFSRPLTGQSLGAKSYPANKVIDRIVSHKRDNDQTQNGAINLLWLDLTHGFDLGCTNTQPQKTILHAGYVYTGSFGVWHAFYGKKNESKFAPERLNLQYAKYEPYYVQQKEGLFRQREHLHGAILSTKDGVIFFENPWASMILPEPIKKKITQLFRFRANFSWFQYGKNQLSKQEIENELAKINWLYENSDSQ